MTFFCRPHPAPAPVVLLCTPSYTTVQPAPGAALGAIRFYCNDFYCHTEFSHCCSCSCCCSLQLANAIAVAVAIAIVVVVGSW